MGKKKWNIKVGERDYNVGIEHGYLSGKRVITLNEEVVYRGSNPLDFGSQHKFEIDGHSVESEEIVSEHQSIPKWTWFFVAICVAIPVVSIGGGIPAAIGVGGAFACISVVRKSSQSRQVQALICTVVSLVCWVLFALIVVGISSL